MVERCVLPFCTGSLLRSHHLYCALLFFQHLLLAQQASESQKKGKPGQLVDPRPETVEGGEIKIRITPQLVHDIFDEYPVVAKAYSENVPENVRFNSLYCLNGP